MAPVPLCPGGGASFKKSNGLVSHLCQTTNYTCQQVFDRLITIGLKDEILSPHSSDIEDNASEISGSSDEDIIMEEPAVPYFEEEIGENHSFSEEVSFEEAMNLDVDMDIQFRIEDDVEDSLENFEGLPDLESDDEDSDEEEYHW